MTTSHFNPLTASIDDLRQLTQEQIEALDIDDILAGIEDVAHYGDAASYMDAASDAGDDPAGLATYGICSLAAEQLSFHLHLELSTVQYAVEQIQEEEATLFSAISALEDLLQAATPHAPHDPTNERESWPTWMPAAVDACTGQMLEDLRTDCERLILLVKLYEGTQD